MGSRLGKKILQFAMIVSTATCVCTAQNPAEDVLPDAPMPTGSEAAIIPAEKKEAHPVRQQFSVGINAKKMYGQTYRRVVSKQMPVKALFVSGWEVGTAAG